MKKKQLGKFSSHFLEDEAEIDSFERWTAYTSNSMSSIKLFTKEDVKKHKKENDAWTIINGEVYDITPFIHKHPGGLLILKHIGDDSTESFKSYGHGKVAEDILKKHKIGSLSESSTPKKTSQLDLKNLLKEDILSSETLSFHSTIKNSSEFQKFKKYAAKDFKKGHYIQFLIDVDNFAKKKEVNDFSKDVIWNMAEIIFFEYISPLSENFLELSPKSFSDCLIKFQKKNESLFTSPEQEISILVVNDLFPEYQLSQKKKRKSISLVDILGNKKRETKTQPLSSINKPRIDSNSFETEGFNVFELRSPKKLSSNDIFHFDPSEVETFVEEELVIEHVESFTKISPLKEEMKEEKKDMKQTLIKMKSFYPVQSDPTIEMVKQKEPEINKSKNQQFMDSIVNGDFKTFLEYTNDPEIDIFQKNQQETLLHIAVLSNSFPICEYLINNGLDVNGEDRLFRTSLHLVCTTGNNDIALLLLGNQAKVNIRDHYGWTPLMLALKQHFFEIADNLILFNADINFKRDNGITAFHEGIQIHLIIKAAQHGDEQIFKWLARQNDIKLNAKDQMGATPFIRSLEKAPVSFVEKLIHFEGIDHFAVDSNGRNLFHMICRNQRNDILKKFLQFDDKKLLPFKKLLSENDKQTGYTPLHYGVKFATAETVKYLLILFERFDEIEIAKDFKNETPSQLCCKKLEESFNEFIGESGIKYTHEMIDRKIVQTIEMKKLLMRKEKDLKKKKK
jgi:ankyrin repeat protein/cytochrome b involved in lipid metabolism